MTSTKDLGSSTLRRVAANEEASGNSWCRVAGRPLVGFENHGGVTTLADSLAPLGTVERGVGNDGSVDGFRTPTIWATYAHGPLLAMNPWFADEITRDGPGSRSRTAGYGRRPALRRARRHAHLVVLVGRLPYVGSPLTSRPNA